MIVLVLIGAGVLVTLAAIGLHTVLQWAAKTPETKE